MNFPQSRPSKDVIHSLFFFFPLYAFSVEKARPDFDDSLYRYLCDAHCHPHDDIDNLDAIARLKVAHVTIMGVREADWEVVKMVVEICQTAKARGEREATGAVTVGKAVPCFGGFLKSYGLQFWSYSEV